MQDERVDEESVMTAAVGMIAENREAARAALAEAVSRSHEGLPWLLDAARSGNADAFAALVRYFQEPVYRFVLRMVRRPNTAEDISQEVFIRFWRHLGEMESPDMVQGWLRRVAANAVIDHWRQDESRHRRLQVLREHPVARHVVKPSGRMESQEVLDAVQAALDSLPAKLRSALVLRTIEGLSYDELAEVLGISSHAVRSRLFRARSELHKMLNRQKAAEFLARMYKPAPEPEA